jgi:hypothetical protein
MTEKQSFGVVVRGFGLYTFLWGAISVGGIVRDYGFRGLQVYDWQPAAAFAAFYFIFAFVLLAKADAIVELAYRPKTAAPSSN